uniref:Prickle-like protein 4 n=1 Tax=Geotrypetes seraphini TaxID=260995 RepID=A0A6P8NWR2_GEOSA|nr:prickle-like protein 4 [Geotrypetes seraphini]
MAVLSPVDYRRVRSPCTETQAVTSDASASDSDSGCVLEEEIQPATQVNSARADLITSLHLKALLSQLPAQDSEVKYCHWILGEREREELQRFSAWRRLNSLGQAILQPLASLRAEFCCCHQCGRQMKRGEMAVWASELGDHRCWHPSCFTCATCCQPLLDLIFFHQDGELYCGRHHAELFRPRCASCDQAGVMRKSALIFAKELTEAEGWSWHVEHFCCTDCEVVLGGQRYVMKSGSPYCMTCFQSFHTETCTDSIGLDCEHVSYQGQHWHARTACFCCDSCQKSLLGLPFIPRDGVLFCSEICSWSRDSASHETQRNSSETVEAWNASHHPRASKGHGTSVETQKDPSEPPVISLQRHRSAQDSKTREELSLRHKPDWKGDLFALHGPSCSALMTHRQSPQQEGRKQSWKVHHQHKERGKSGQQNQTLSGQAPCSDFPANFLREAGNDLSTCSTCSSSSLSEQEGFFFGKPIPGCRITDSTCPQTVDQRKKKCSVC